MQPDLPIRYRGAPEMTEEGVEVMAIHLHRFLVHWLEHHHELDVLWVTLGFEGSACASATFALEPQTCQAHEVGWTFEDLCHTYRRGDSRLHMEAGAQGAQVFYAVPILDHPAMGGQARAVLGFALVPEEADVSEEAIQILQTHTYEAICAARRNATRLFFDERRTSDVKSLLYAFMEHLPEWVGCDASAMMVLASSLETMTLEDAPSARFSVLAERTYTVSERERSERLVGMTVDVDADVGPHVLSAAYERQREDPNLPYQCFVAEEGDAGDMAWRSLDTDQTYAPFHRVRTRIDEAMLVLVPVVAEESSESELLGFLALTWRGRCELTSASGALLAEGATNLATSLRHSPLYTLGARKLWILRRVRRASEAILERAESEDHHELLTEFIGVTSELIASHVEVPSFAIAYMEHEEREEEGTTRRMLRYVRPYGWAHYERLQLPVDVAPERRTDSSVASLSVRLGRPLVLAGGYEEGDELHFKNSLFVEESLGEVRDVRSGRLQDAPGEWIPLSEYYMPAREQAYATLTYPIAFANTPIGVLAVEVDKQTDWLWWTGFGGHLFWQMLASELATAFYTLGVRGR